MSTEIGGKDVAEQLVAQSKGLVAQARGREEQLGMFDPLLPEEMLAAQERLGPNAGTTAVLAEARRGRGRPRGSKNKRSTDFANFILAHGTHPAITMMQIQSTPPEVLVERSRQIDPVKRRMSYADAQALRTRCAEGLLPYIESKKPMAVELDVNGDFNLLIPGVNISAEDAQSMADGTFVFAENAEFTEITGGENGE